MRRSTGRRRAGTRLRRDRSRTVSVLYDYGPLLAAAPVLVFISDIDRRTRRIPDRLSLLVLAVTAATMMLLTLRSDTASSFGNGAIGAAMLASLLGAVHLLRPDGLGLGDVKLALTLGLLLGWSSQSAIGVAAMVAWTLMVASTVGLVTVAIIVRRDGVPARGTAVAFGPALCAGTVAVVLFGPSLVIT